MNPKYYDGTKLLSLMDIDGNRPEIYICSANRTAGKTTYWGRYLINRYLKHGEKFCLIYRFRHELSNVADNFFKDIGARFFPEYTMESLPQAGGVFQELYLIPTDEMQNDLPKQKKKQVSADFSCGYAISLNSADALKRLSHYFVDVATMYFDEFQSETNHYCENEVAKLQSVHTSFARGFGKQVRYLRVILCGNPVTLLNPYYAELGISSILSPKTKFLRGHGFVLEQGYNDSAASAQKESAFNRAFSASNYLTYSADGLYMNDSKAFVEKLSGTSNYVCTLKFMGEEYAIRTFPGKGLVYCDNRIDETFPLKIACTTEDHEINYIMLHEYSDIISTLRYYFERGCFRFRNLKCKDAVLKILSY